MCLALSLGMTVAEARERIGVDEFHDWQEFFSYRKDLAEIGPRAMNAVTLDDAGKTDHEGIARDLTTALSSIAKDFK